MQPKVKPRTAWAIVHKRKQNFDIFSIRPEEMECIEEFLRGRKFNWNHWERLGYRCIKVNIVPVDE